MKKSFTLNDLRSSLVVFLVALPLCLGISLASGAPLSSGIISGIVGGIVVGFISGSQISVSGPAAGLTVIVATGINEIGGFQNFGLVIVVAGLLQVLFALIKGGSIGEFFPVAVIKGMLAAIGLILIIKQLPTVLGISSFSSPLTNYNGGIVLISSMSLAIMLLWEKLASTGDKVFKLLPGALVAVVVSIIANKLFKLVDSSYIVNLPANLFSDFRMPRFSQLNFSMFQIAITIAVVASLESLLSIDAADKIDPKKRTTSKNRELFAQGIGNAVSGLFGGLPITAVIVRTSANVAAGASSKWSAVIHGSWLLLCVLLIPQVLNSIPLATLACVLLLVGYKLTKPSFYIEMWKRGPDQLLVFIVTIVTILGTDLLKGIFAGLAIAIVFEMKKPAIKCVQVVKEGRKIHIKFVNNVSFFHKSQIAKLLNEVGETEEVHFHGLHLVRVHVDVHELIRDYQEEAKKQNLEVFFEDKDAA